MPPIHPIPNPPPINQAPLRSPMLDGNFTTSSYVPPDAAGGQGAGGVPQPANSEPHAPNAPL